MHDSTWWFVYVQVARQPVVDFLAKLKKSTESNLDLLTTNNSYICFNCSQTTYYRRILIFELFKFWIKWIYFHKSFHWKLFHNRNSTGHLFFLKGLDCEQKFIKLKKSRDYLPNFFLVIKGLLSNPKIKNAKANTRIIFSISLIRIDYRFFFFHFKIQFLNTQNFYLKI